MTRKQERGDETGAALILALILVTVVAVVISVVLSFADTSLRVTVAAARPEAASAANADGAAQVAINTLRNSLYTTGPNCFPDSAGHPLAAASLSLSNFPVPNTSAYVSCSPDPGSGIPVAINNNNKPGEAVLTLGANPSEDGINIKVSGGQALIIHGGTFSNSNVNVTLGSLTTDTTATWLLARTTCTGTFTGVGGTGTFPNKSCGIGNLADPRGLDPAVSNPSGYAAPTSAASTAPLRAIPSCPANKQVTFLPGIYTDAAALSTFMSSSGCKNGVFLFSPGTYFFNFGTSGGAADKWTINTGSLLGGTPSPAAAASLAAGSAPAMPGSCVNPLTTVTPVGTTYGVQFVFGGDSQMYVRQSSVELCGMYDPNNPPIAIYGLKSALPAPALGVGGSIPAETGCVTAQPYPSTGCPVVQSDNSPNSKLFIKGTTYTAPAVLAVGLNNNTAQVFEDGLIARSLWLDATGSGVPTGPVINLPDNSPGYTNGDTVVYLTVYVCAASSTCSSSGRLALRAKVDIVDGTLGAPVSGQRQITVTNWGVQR